MRNIVMIGISLCCLVSEAFATPTALEQLFSFSAAKTMSADFVQEQYQADGTVGKMSGQLWVAQPAKFRWEYQKPYQQIVVSNGTKVWFYEPDLNQVIIRSQGQAIGDKPILLLSDPKAAQRYFDMKNVDIDADKNYSWVEAIPKSKENSTFSSILIGFLARKPQKLVFKDAFNNQTVVSLTNIRLNQPIDVQKFVFTPPKGVEVLSDN